MWNYFKKSFWEPKEPFGSWKSRLYWVNENERLDSLKRAGMPITTKWERSTEHVLSAWRLGSMCVDCAAHRKRIFRVRKARRWHLWDKLVISLHVHKLLNCFIYNLWNSQKFWSFVILSTRFSTIPCHFIIRRKKNWTLLVIQINAKSCWKKTNTKKVSIYWSDTLSFN